MDRSLARFLVARFSFADYLLARLITDPLAIVRSLPSSAHFLRFARRQLYDEWNWSEVYAPQPELMTYVHHLIKRYNLSPHLQFNSRVSSCVWSDDEGKWTVTVDNKESGEKEVWKAKYLVWCTGCLSSPNIPTFPGSEEFKGQLYHTGLWPRDKVDFKGKRVAVIGTGSSGIQTIPVVAADAASLTCFQRTPTYSIPAWNRPVTPEELAEAKADSQALRKRALTHELGNPCLYYTPRLYSDFSPSEIEPHLEMVWNLGGANMYGVWADMLTDKKANEVASEFVRRKIRETVKDKETAELLCPDYPLGCKRSGCLDGECGRRANRSLDFLLSFLLPCSISSFHRSHLRSARATRFVRIVCVDTNYYATYNLPHVKLVSIKSNPFKSVGPNDKITLSDGSEYGPFDIIVSATGFDAITGAISKVDVTGRGGLTLKKAWEEGPVNYLGRFVHGFPNMFMITGPGSPGVVRCFIVPSIESS